MLTWQPHTLATRHQAIGELVGVARERGIPAPRYEHVLQVGAAAVVVQELLPGAPPQRATPELVETMVRLNGRFRGALADRLDLPTAELYLRRGGPGFCLHEPLRAYSARTGRLLDRIHQIGATRPTTMTGQDLVHLDYQPPNVLIDPSGALTGVVDWDGAARGDADFDLVVLFFMLHSTGGSATTIAWLEQRLRTQLPPDLLRAYWAHMSLRMVDWAIRHHGPDDVDTWLHLAERGLDADT